MGVYLPNGRLPSAYQEVEYIQSSGTQYFVVGSSFKTSYKSVIDMEMVTTGGDYVPLGVLINDASKRYGIDAWSSYFKVISGGSSWSNTISEDKNRHTFILNKSTATVDGTDYSMSYVDYTFSGGIGVFAYHNVTNNISEYRASAKIYKLDIYDENGVHIYDLIPCYRKSDSVIGMYDIINDTFYTNSGTGTFSKGADITMVELKNAYIGQGIFSYSYDFTTGSIADLTSQGWTIPATCSIVSSSGLTASNSWSQLDYTPPDLASFMTDAKTVYMYLKINKTGNSERWYGIMNGETECAYQYSNGTAQQIKIGGTSYLNTSSSMSNGTYEITLSIDLENKSATYDMGKSGLQGTVTITDANITTVRTASGIRMYISGPSYIEKISLTVG